MRLWYVKGRGSRKDPEFEAFKEPDSLPCRNEDTVTVSEKSNECKAIGAIAYHVEVFHIRQVDKPWRLHAIQASAKMSG